MPLVGVRRKGILGSVEAPLSLLDAISFLQGVCPWYHSRRLYVPNLCQRPTRLTFPEEARRSPRCTYPLILALEGNILDDCSITFPWSSARQWVPRVWLAPWPGPLWVRFAGEEGQVEGQVRAGRRTSLRRRQVAGVREAWPPPRGCRMNSLGFCSSSTPWAAKASPYCDHCTCRAGRRLSRRCARPTGVGGVCCTAALCRVVRGGPLKQDWLARGCGG